ncbi:MAG: lytic murein transglycosylase B [Neisseria sp.]|uniref:lytic murein transglycosylase B n=1 Tax=Neisseria sp. TaxID=192066 RepID=UPI0026DD64F2|nr:lytic murein transglycosylase B [Neisseria sp.]MDO4248034.1 lytic murein transglycosylase B [Neisseria sp.]
MKTRMLIIAAALILAACAVEHAQQPKDTVGTPVEPVAKGGMPHFNRSAADSVATTGFNANPNVQAFIDYQVKHNGFSKEELRSFFDNVAYKGNIINIMDKPGTSNPWYKFREGNAGAAKIAGGQRFYQQNRQVIDQVARQYGVPAEIIVAIIGIETNYGRNTGSFRVADALATLAFEYPRRSEFFQKELNDLLLMSREEREDIFDFTGSYAGAMGMPQFMPSSYRKWAVDFDGDGHRDIWGSVPDVAASVANYMKAHGWQSGGKVVVPVSLSITPELQAVIDEKTALKYSVGQLRKMGVTPLEPVADHERAILYRLETMPGTYEYFIGLNNFYAIWQYNHSRMYVTAVRDIANGVGTGRW